MTPRPGPAWTTTPPRWRLRAPGPRAAGPAAVRSAHSPATPPPGRSESEADTPRARSSASCHASSHPAAAGRRRPGGLDLHQSTASWQSNVGSARMNSSPPVRDRPPSPWIDHQAGAPAGTAGTGNADHLGHPALAHVENDLGPVPAGEGLRSQDAVGGAAHPWRVAGSGFRTAGRPAPASPVPRTDRQQRHRHRRRPRSPLGGPGKRPACTSADTQPVGGTGCPRPPRATAVHRAGREPHLPRRDRRAAAPERQVQVDGTGACGDATASATGTRANDRHDRRAALSATPGSANQRGHAEEVGLVDGLGAPRPGARADGRRCSIRGTRARSASTTAACSSAAAVPLVVTTTAGRPVAMPIPRAVKPAERSSSRRGPDASPGPGPAGRPRPGHTTAWPPRPGPTRRPGSRRRPPGRPPSPTGPAIGTLIAWPATSPRYAHDAPRSRHPQPPAARRSAGSGPPLVMAHGFTQTGRVWGRSTPTWPPTTVVWSTCPATAVVGRAPPAWSGGPCWADSAGRADLPRVLDGRPVLPPSGPGPPRPGRIAWS